MATLTATPAQQTSEHRSLVREKQADGSITTVFQNDVVHGFQVTGSGSGKTNIGGPAWVPRWSLTATSGSSSRPVEIGYGWGSSVDGFFPAPFGGTEPFTLSLAFYDLDDSVLDGPVSVVIS